MLSVALDAGISPETLRKIEVGRISTPAFGTIAALAMVLELSLDALWAEVRDGERVAPRDARHADGVILQA